MGCSTFKRLFFVNLAHDLCCSEQTQKLINMKISLLVAVILILSSSVSAQSNVFKNFSVSIGPELSAVGTLENTSNRLINPKKLQRFTTDIRFTIPLKKDYLMATGIAYSSFDYSEGSEINTVYTSMMRIPIYFGKEASVKKVSPGESGKIGYLAGVNASTLYEIDDKKMDQFYLGVGMEMYYKFFTPNSKLNHSIGIRLTNQLVDLSDGSWRATGSSRNLNTSAIYWRLGWN
jgi:hypothetical protein